MKGMEGLQARAAALSLAHGPGVSSSSKGNVMEVLVMTTIVEKFGGKTLTEFVTTLHPSLVDELPKWCSKHRLPRTCVVGAMKDLCPGGGLGFFETPDMFVNRGLLPDTTMGPGEC